MAQGKAPTNQAARRGTPEPRGVGDAAANDGLFVDGAPQGLRKNGRAGAQPQASNNAAGLTLTCTRGPEQGQVLQLPEGSYTVGRARDNHLVLKDIAASRKHLRIDIDGRGARLVDLGSGNGTRVNGKRISDCELRHGDKVEIGGSVLVFAESGRAVPASDDSSQVIAHADRLAAELARKPFGEEVHRASTRALPTRESRAQEERVAAEGGQPRRAAADRLWNETATNLALSDVVPGGGRRPAPRPDRPDVRHEVHFVEPPRASAPSPTRKPAPPPLLEPAEFSPVYDERSPLLVAAGSAGVILLVAGVVLAGWWLFARENGDEASPVAATSAPKPPKAEVVAAGSGSEFDTAMVRAQAAVRENDWQKALEYATTALQLRPADPIAALLMEDARSKVGAVPPASRGPAQRFTAPAPTPPAQASPAPAQAGGAPDAKPAVDVTPAAASAAPKPAEPTPPAAAPSTQTEPRQRPRVESNARPAPRPAPPPAARPSAKGMSDEEANEAFEAAVDAFRNKEGDKGCRILERVGARAPSNSVWKSKADKLFGKRCNGDKEE